MAAQREAARPSVELLRSGQFDQALDAAQKVIAHDGDNAQARAVAALTRFLAAAHRARGDVMTLGGQVVSGSINDEYFRFSLGRLRDELGKVEADLAAASAHPEFELELCIACWEHDWNGNGRIDDRDRRLLEIEIDAEGHDLPDGDPRRRPTFHFDVGDLFWARAMVDFQRALIEMLLAYRWDEAAHLPAMMMFRHGSDGPTRSACRCATGPGSGEPAPWCSQGSSRPTARAAPTSTSATTIASGSRTRARRATRCRSPSTTPSSRPGPRWPAIWRA